VGGARATRGEASGGGDGKAATLFVLLWSTGPDTFGCRPRRCIESILHHHPTATVHVYANLLPLGFFSAFTTRRFDVRVVRYDVGELLAQTPAAPWLHRLDEWRAGRYYYSHVTDVLRFAILFRTGGVYLDFDVIVVRPFTLPSPPAADADADADAETAVGSSGRLDGWLGIESYEGLGGQAGPTLNGAVMAFERGSRFLWNCLDEFAATYMADRWSWNGPELLTRVQRKCAGVSGADVQVEPRESFYPIYWKGFEAFAEGTPSAEAAQMWAAIGRWSFAAHVWNRKTAGLAFVNGSLLHRLHNTWTVLPGEPSCS